MAQYTEVGTGLDETRGHLRTTAGVLIGDEGFCVLEVFETHRFAPSSQYAEVAFSLDGARQLRDLLNKAIERLELAA